MAKKKKEELQKASAEWMNTFADLMNLLLCFFVLLFAMSTVDAQKFEAIAASFSQTFSIFTGGQVSIGDGMLLGNGVSQLNELDQYMDSMGKKAENEEEAEKLYRTFGQVYRQVPPKWRVLVITSHPEFEHFFGRKSDEKRKLYNGMLKCDLYQFSR